jgi:hypothetical protein
VYLRPNRKNIQGRLPRSSSSAFQRSLRYCFDSIIAPKYHSRIYQLILHLVWTGEEGHEEKHQTKDDANRDLSDLRNPRG